MLQMLETNRTFKGDSVILGEMTECSLELTQDTLGREPDGGTNNVRLCSGSGVSLGFEK